MHIARSCYIGKELSKEADQIFRAIKYGTSPQHVYVIYENMHTKRPEVVKGRELKQLYYQNRAFKLLGITKTYEEALAYLLVYALGEYGIG